MPLNILYIGNHNPSIEKLRRNKSFNLQIHSNGLEAYCSLEDSKKNWDGIISEMNLPGLKGEELVDHYQTINSARISFILIAEQFDIKKRREWLRKGISDAYLYDFNPSDLEERITFINSLPQEDKILPGSDEEYKIPIIKRVFDICVAGTALLVLMPVFILISISIWLESRGTVYYISKRVGTGYHVFDFYKFRSMYTGADKKLKDLKHLNQYAEEPANTDIQCSECKKLGHACSSILYIDNKQICERQYLLSKAAQNKSSFIKIKDDPRVSKVGKFIRNTSIDELPQLFNVLKGDMSIVGNRPLPLYEAELLTSDQWSQRFLAPAGLTGLWQVKKRGKGKMSDEERKCLDNDYAMNFSFWFDIKIILMTIPALFQKENV